MGKKNLFAIPTVIVSDTLSSGELSAVFSVPRDLRDANCRGVELPKILSLFKHSESCLTFVCEPWGVGVATLHATYNFKTQAGGYYIRPEFFIDNNVAAVKSSNVVMMRGDFYDISLCDFLNEIEKRISESSCIISSDAACTAASNFRLEFNGHTMTRTYKADYILFTNDSGEENETFTMQPASEGGEVIIRYILSETTKGILTEMVRVS